jgi:hypothetical protein
VVGHCHDEVTTEESADSALDYKLLGSLNPDHRGGFSRIGRLIRSHATIRGRHKGRIVHTILTALNQQLKRDGDEVELVK